MEIQNAALQNDYLIKKWSQNTLIGIAVYIILELAVQLLPPHYSIRQAESNLALGPYGIIMNINFMVRGLLTCYIVLAIKRCIRRSPVALMGLVFISIWGIGSFLLAFFNADLSDTVKPVQPTFHGQIHALLAGISYICAPVGILITSLSFQTIFRFRPLGLGVLIVSLICVLSFIYLGQSGVYAQNYGVFERIGIGSVLFWCAIVALELRKDNPNNYSVK